MPRLYGEKIMLREYRRDDLPRVMEWVNEAEIVDNLSDIFLYPRTEESTLKFWNAVLTEELPSKAHFVIANAETEEYLGQIDLVTIDWKNRSAVLGIVIGRTGNCGRGYGGEALGLMETYVFDRLNLNRLELKVKRNNERALRCYRRCGFVEEGAARQAFFINGEYVDMVQMSILRDEYLRRHKSPR